MYVTQSDLLRNFYALEYGLKAAFEVILNFSRWTFVLFFYCRKYKARLYHNLRCSIKGYQKL